MLTLPNFGEEMYRNQLKFSLVIAIIDMLD